MSPINFQDSSNVVYSREKYFQLWLRFCLILIRILNRLSLILKWWASGIDVDISILTRWYHWKKVMKWNGWMKLKCFYYLFFFFWLNMHETLIFSLVIPRQCQEWALKERSQLTKTEALCTMSWWDPMRQKISEWSQDKAILRNQQKGHEKMRMGEYET
jgi:hypothetical protein